MNQPLWQPSAAVIELSPMHQFMQEVNKRYKLDLKDYSELFDWSVSNLEGF